MEVVLKKSVDGPKAGKNFLNKTTTLFSAPIPGAGIKVPKIFKLGAAVQLDVGTGAKVTAEGNFTMGLTASLNDGAKVTTDLINSERSSQTGLGVDFDPIFQVNSLKGSVSVSASAQPKLTFGIEIVKVGRLDAYLGMKLPEVTAQLDDVIFDKSGACSSSGSKSGIKLTSSINVGVNVGVDASLGKTKAPVIDHELWGRKFPLLDKCLDVGSGQKVTTTSTSLPPGPTPATVPKGKNIPQR
ncbi:MAG: hypothetical protein M1833_003807 [Piccolia ochrophora]|nr:MAG: hypothetical protein M1833_003807 [Piccolia ochrophora]